MLLCLMSRTCKLQKCRVTLRVVPGNPPHPHTLRLVATAYIDVDTFEEQKSVRIYAYIVQSEIYKFTLETYLVEKYSWLLTFGYLIRLSCHVDRPR